MSDAEIQLKLGRLSSNFAGCNFMAWVCFMLVGVGLHMASDRINQLEKSVVELQKIIAGF